MRSHRKKAVVSLRSAAVFITAILVIPLFLAVMLFDVYAVSQQQETLQTSHKSTLQLYETQWEETLSILEQYLGEAVVNDTYFASMVYASKQVDAHVAAYNFGRQSQVLLWSLEYLGGFSLYSQPFDVSCLVYDTDYSPADMTLLREAAQEVAKTERLYVQWTPLEFSDRTVLLLAFSYRKNVAACIVDPALLDSPAFDGDATIFFVQPDGTAYYPQGTFDGAALPEMGPSGDPVIADMEDGRLWEFTALELGRDLGYIVYAQPARSFLGQLSLVQKVLLFITMVLLLCIPVGILSLRRFLVAPLGRLCYFLTRYL